MMRPTGINDPEMLLCDIMDRWPQTIPVFLKYKMLCVGCVITPYHTIRDACVQHDVLETRFRQDLLKAITQH